MSKSIAFVAAPYGFGPSSKAIAISSYLPRSIERAFLSEAPQIAMARRAGEFSSYVHLDFRTDREIVTSLFSAYDVLVFVNSTRYMAQVIKLGRPTILVETLAWLREEPPQGASALSGYFAQRFFDHPFGPQLEAIKNFQPVGAIVPKTIAIADGGKHRTCAKKSPLLHCGGLYSPAMREGAECAFVKQAFSSIVGIKGPLRAILPASLHDRFRAIADNQLSLIDCSPLSVHEHIMDSEYSITTTGIEFTYESFLLGVPTLFLPPFNSSQTYQLTYHFEICRESVPFSFVASNRENAFAALHSSTSQLQQIGVVGVWRDQFAEVSRFLSSLGTNERSSVLSHIGDKQRRAMKGLSTDGAVTVAAHALKQLGYTEAFQ